VENRASGPVDGARRDPIQRSHELGVKRAVSETGQALPAAADADDLGSHLDRPMDDGLDHGIQARDIAAPGQDADAAGCGHLEFLLLIASRRGKPFAPGIGSGPGPTV